MGFLHFGYAYAFIGLDINIRLDLISSVCIVIPDKVCVLCVVFAMGFLHFGYAYALIGLEINIRLDLISNVCIIIPDQDAHLLSSYCHAEASRAMFANLG